ncbi:hypothetical protein C5167_026872 [Papaver somniferum]|nr:hypothetical protein C5167_026872 [Papaver somniferum]
MSLLISESLVFGGGSSERPTRVALKVVVLFQMKLRKLFLLLSFLKLHLLIQSVPRDQCVWAAAEAYSAPFIVLTSHSHEDLHGSLILGTLMLEKVAWEIFNSGCKYVLVVLGGLVGYPSHDISKFLSMERIMEIPVV